MLTVYYSNIFTAKVKQRNGRNTEIFVPVASEVVGSDVVDCCGVGIIILPSIGRVTGIFNTKLNQ